MTTLVTEGACVAEMPLSEVKVSDVCGATGREPRRMWQDNTERVQDAGDQPKARAGQSQESSQQHMVPGFSDGVLPPANSEYRAARTALADSEFDCIQLYHFPGSR